MSPRRSADGGSVFAWRGRRRHAAGRAGRVRPHIALTHTPVGGNWAGRRRSGHTCWCAWTAGLPANAAAHDRGTAPPRWSGSGGGMGPATGSRLLTDTASDARTLVPIPTRPIDALPAPTYLPPSKRFDVPHRNDSMNPA
jgi:hypothetical protein